MKLGFVWVIITILVALILHDYIVPFIKDKLLCFMISRLVRKIAKEEPNPKSKKRLEEIADEVDLMRKNLKLGDD